MTYNKSEIMKRAWEMYRAYNSVKGRITVSSFSDCLRASWKIAKDEAAEKAQEGGEFKSGMEITANGYAFIVNRWTAYGKDRIYINRGTRSCGYMDVKSGRIYGLNEKVNGAARAAEILKTLKIA